MKTLSLSLTVCTLLFCLMAESAAADPATLSLDEAIQSAAKDIEGNLGAGTKIAFLNFTSSAPAFSEYVIEELTAVLVRDKKLVVVDRNNLDIIRKEMNFQNAGEVSDESAQALGKMLGAQSIVSGAFTYTGDAYRFRVRTINVGSAAIEVLSSLTVKNDKQVSYLLTGTAPAAKPAPENPPPTVAGSSSPPASKSATEPQFAAPKPAVIAVPSSQPVPVVSPSNPENYKILKTFEGPRYSYGEYVNVIFSPDGTRIVSSSSGGSTLTIWDWRKGSKLKTFTNDSSVRSVSYSPDGRRIVTGSSNSLRIWDAESGAYRVVFNNTGINSAAYSPDGKKIVSINSGNTIKICDANSGRELQTISAEGKNFGYVIYSPDGKRIVSGSDYDTNSRNINIWDAETGKLIKSKLRIGTTCLAYSPNGKQIAVGGEDYADRASYVIKIFDAETFEEIWTLSGHSGTVNSITFSSDGKRIISGSSDGTIRVWDTESGWEIKQLLLENQAITRLAYSSDRKYIVSISNDGTIRVWGME